MKTTKQEREAWMNSDGDHLNRHAVHRLLEDFAALEAKLAACEWKPITETDLPKVGDEVIDPNLLMVQWLEEDDVYLLRLDASGWINEGYTHFRPINLRSKESHE